MKTWATLMVGLVAGSLLAGCSGESGDPAATNVPLANSGLPHSGAPKVENPIDTEQFEANPCSVISERQFSGTEITIDEVEPEVDDSFGPTCDWAMPLGSGGFAGTFFTANTVGLSAQYEKNQADEWAYFEELSIDSYPAVVNSSTDNRKNGDCTLNVGVRDDLTYILTLSLGTENPYRTKPCELAEELATMAIQTMTGGA